MEEDISSTVPGIKDKRKVYHPVDNSGKPVVRNEDSLTQPYGADGKIIQKAQKGNVVDTEA